MSRRSRAARRPGRERPAGLAARGRVRPLHAAGRRGAARAGGAVHARHARAAAAQEHGRRRRAARDAAVALLLPPRRRLRRAAGGRRREDAPARARQPRDPGLRDHRLPRDAVGHRGRRPARRAVRDRPRAARVDGARPRRARGPRRGDDGRDRAAPREPAGRRGGRRAALRGHARLAHARGQPARADVRPRGGDRGGSAGDVRGDRRAGHARVNDAHGHAAATSCSRAWPAGWRGAGRRGRGLSARRRDVLCHPRRAGAARGRCSSRSGSPIAW